MALEQMIEQATTMVKFISAKTVSEMLTDPATLQYLREELGTSSVPTPPPPPPAPSRASDVDLLRLARAGDLPAEWVNRMILLGASIAQAEADARKIVATAAKSELCESGPYGPFRVL